ncbi:hypothetical protein MSG28_000140 [Choristoneura fumiferana]|uniref:Uncharacterized protein n=1 Tax=Choristoneura fumiferana TaxID=7141 RepID=A0ACC0JZT2_CHOFU|nr:hypothetical protein MSG28_000140 [Choristoneura fumiferana]
MCQTIKTCLQSIVCILQMLVRIFMTIVLMVENLLRLVMQTIYNLLSFITQAISIIPICCVMIMTSKLRTVICGAGAGKGGAGGVSKNKTCDCVISTLIILVIFFIFRETGVLEKILFKLGYMPSQGLKDQLTKSSIPWIRTKHRYVYVTTAATRSLLPGDTSLELSSVTNNSLYDQFMNFNGTDYGNIMNGTGYGNVTWTGNVTYTGTVDKKDISKHFG